MQKKCNFMFLNSSIECIHTSKMKKTLYNLSVILVILPVSFGGSEKMGCNNSKCKSEKKTEVKHQDTDDKSKDSDLKKDKKNTFHMNSIGVV